MDGLEHQLHAELAASRTVCRHDAAKRRRTQEGIGQIEIRMIEQIERLCTELQPYVT